MLLAMFVLALAWIVCVALGAIMVLIGEASSRRNAPAEDWGIGFVAVSFLPGLALAIVSIVYFAQN